MVQYTDRQGFTIEVDTSNPDLVAVAESMGLSPVTAPASGGAITQDEADQIEAISPGASANIPIITGPITEETIAGTADQDGGQTVVDDSPGAEDGLGFPRPTDPQGWVDAIEAGVISRGQALKNTNLPSLFRGNNAMANKYLRDVENFRAGRSTIRGILQATTAGNFKYVLGEDITTQGGISEFVHQSEESGFRLSSEGSASTVGESVLSTGGGFDPNTGLPLDAEGNIIFGGGGNPSSFDAPTGQFFGQKDTSFADAVGEPDIITAGDPFAEVPLRDIFKRFVLKQDFGDLAEQSALNQQEQAINQFLLQGGQTETPAGFLGEERAEEGFRGFLQSGRRLRGEDLLSRLRRVAEVTTAPGIGTFETDPLALTLRETFGGAAGASDRLQALLQPFQQRGNRLAASALGRVFGREQAKFLESDPTGNFLAEAIRRNLGGIFGGGV